MPPLLQAAPAYVDAGLLKRLNRASVDPNPFQFGVTKPNATNTGIPAGVVLGTAAPAGITVTAGGDWIVTASNVVIDACDIPGRVLVRAANVTVRRSRIRGGAPSGNTALIDCNHASAANVFVELCDLWPDVPNYYTNAIIGHDYTIQRCHAYNVVDHCGVYNSYNPNAAIRVRIYGNYFHDLAYFSPDPNHPTDNRTHNDGVQVQGNSDIEIVGNVIEALCSNTAGNGYPGASSVPPANNPYYPSVTGQCVGVTPAVSKVSNLLVDRNWLDGGAQSITVIPATFGIDGTTFTITRNRFGRRQPLLSKNGVSAKRAILADPSLLIAGFPTTTGLDTQLGNVYDDTGEPVTIYRIVG